MRGPFVAAVALAAGTVGCMDGGSKSAKPPSAPGVVCTTQFVYGLTVTVREKSSGQRVCDAEVVALAQAHRETLMPFGPSDACTYSGAGERPGVYDLRATRTGFREAAVGGVAVGANECHVIPVAVVLELER